MLRLSEERTFPKLMTLAGDQHGPEEMVVFFSDRTNGMVVHSTIPGMYGTIQTFDPDNFVDAPESIIIWLTEGPKEPVEEAIRLVDRINGLDAALDDSFDPSEYTPVEDVAEKDKGDGW